MEHTVKVCLAYRSIATTSVLFAAIGSSDLSLPITVQAMAQSSAVSKGGRGMHEGDSISAPSSLCKNFQNDQKRVVILKE